MRDEPQSPEMLRELAALDAALAGEPVEPDLADLAELSRLLREERPTPGEPFVHALDERVRERFARGTRAAPLGATRVRGWLGRRRTASAALGGRRTPLALGALASVLVAAVIGIAATRQQGGAGDTSTSDGVSAVERAAPSGGAGNGASAADRAAPGGAAGSLGGGSGGGGGSGSTVPAPAVEPQRRGSPRTDARAHRFVERSAAVTLATRPADLDNVADGVVRVTDSVGGFVAGSTVTSRRSASFELRIPSSQLPRALRELSMLAHVRERTQATQDITTVVVSARDRLADARAERRGLLRRLAHATTDAQAADLRARLRTVSRQIAHAKASLARAENRAWYATVAVEVVADRSAGPAQVGGTWTPRDALHDALRILEVAAGVALVAGAALLPLGALLALAWFVGRRTVRRRRETALDAL